MGRFRYRIYDATAPYFLTCTIVQWLPLFAQPANVQILFNSLRFLQTEGRLVLYGYVVMENHCHLLAAGSALGQAVASFKSFTAARMLERMAARNSPLLDLLAFHKPGRVRTAYLILGFAGTMRCRLSAELNGARCAPYHGDVWAAGEQRPMGAEPRGRCESPRRGPRPLTWRLNKRPDCWSLS